MQHLRAFFYPTMLVTVVMSLAAMGFLQPWAMERTQETQKMAVQFSHRITETQLQLSNRLVTLYQQSSLPEAFTAQEKHAVEKLLSDATVPGEIDKIGIFTLDCQPFLPTSLSCLPTAPETFRWSWGEGGQAILALQRKIPGAAAGWLVGQIELGPQWFQLHGLSEGVLQARHLHIGRGEPKEEMLYSVGDTGLGLWMSPSIGDKVARFWVASHIDIPGTSVLLFLFLLLLVKMSVQFRREQSQLRQLRNHFFQWCLHLEQNPNTPWKLPQSMRIWSFREKTQVEQAVRSIGVAMQVNHENIGKLIERCATLHKDLTQTKLQLERRNTQQKQHAQHAALSHQVQTCSLALLERIDAYEKTNLALQERMEKVLLEESEPFAKIVSFWNHSIYKHGARKFFRVLDESPSEVPGQTLLEAQITLLRKSSNQVIKVITQFLVNKKKIPNFGATTRSTVAYWYSLSLTGDRVREGETITSHSQALSLVLSLLEQRENAHPIQIVNHAKEENIAAQVPPFVWVAALFYALEALLMLAKPTEKMSVLFNKKEAGDKQHLMFSIMEYQLATAQERQKKIEPSLAKVNALLTPFGVSCHLMQTLSGMCSVSFMLPQEETSTVPFSYLPTADTRQIETVSV